jgi:hypothetical protein
MRIAFFASVLVLGLVLVQAPNLDTVNQTGGTTCGMDGKLKSADAVNPEHHKELNRKKNRYNIPTPANIDPEVTLAAMLAPGDDVGRFDDTKAVRIQGWVVNVLPGGVESCNCYATAHGDRDTHIELGLTPDAGETERVIVEVTPRLRILMNQQQGIDWWTTEALEQGQHAIKGKWLDVTGWLFFDEQHIDEAANTHHPASHKHVWRATCWEVHPITSMNAMDQAPADQPTFHPQFLHQFRQAHRMQIARNPERLKEIQARNQKIEQMYATEKDDEAQERTKK